MAGRSSSRIFNHEELEAEMKKARDEKDAYAQSMFKTSKHSLDSDDDDDYEAAAKKYDVLDPSELEGQEDGTIDYDGEIKITPFNMKEELEEGYFDKQGTYILNREREEGYFNIEGKYIKLKKKNIKDQWIDDIDWVKIKVTEGTEYKQSRDSSSDEELPSLNVTEHYKQIIELMKPGETVQKAICRLGGSKSSRSASSRWKKKKLEEETSAEAVDNENHEKLQLLTRLADDIVQSGNMDIYQQTFEKLSFHLGTKSLDMFGDDFDEKVDETATPRDATQTSPTSGSVNPEDEVMWEFKWESSEDSKIYGPYPTSQMLEWVNDQYFEKGVYVRQCNKPDSAFHSSKRIDFELYL